jgi:CheY-like chemotaxis protein
MPAGRFRCDLNCLAPAEAESHIGECEATALVSRAGGIVAVRKILLVEDTQIVREPLCRLLRAEGYEVVAACDGSEAAGALLDPVAPDLILLDVLMPRLDGITFLSAVRADPRYHNLPVIGLTGTSDPDRLARLRELGVSSIVHKVRFTFEELMNEIGRAVRNQEEGIEPLKN